MVRQETSLRWGLIFALAVLGLIRPLLSILGVYGSFEGPWGPILVTTFIAAIWVGAMIMGGVPNPLLTLAVVGAVYGVLAILLQQTMWNLFLSGPPAGASPWVPILVTSWISLIATNTIWGAFLGLVAAGIRRLLPGRPPQQRPG